MKSIAHRTCLWLISKPIGTIIRLEQVRIKFPDPGESDSATTAMSMLTSAGVIERVGSGTYKVIPGLETWSNNKNWAKAPNRTEKRRASSDHRGEDVIENLLTAMAAAEPELKRLRKKEKLLQEANAV